MNYYLAYGSNLNVEQMRYRCPGAKRIGTTDLNGHRITFRGNSRYWGVANIEPRHGSSVPVGIWQITDQDERNLDRYEGFPRLYDKVTFRVQLPDLRTVDAIAYVMTGGRPWAQPSAYYLETIKQGYRDFGFENRKLLYAARTPVAHLSPEIVKEVSQ